MPSAKGTAGLLALLAAAVTACGDDASAGDAGDDGVDAEAREDGATPDGPGFDDAGGDAEATGPRTCGELRLYPTTNSLGIHLDAPPRDAVGAVVRYRAAGGSWTDGHPLARLVDGRLKGSMFLLDAATAYEVEVDVLDGRGEVLDEYACDAVTEPPLPATETLRTLHVDAAAPAGGDGSEAAPFATIQEGVNAAQPGDVVVVQGGVYHETVEFPRSGEPGRFIQLQGQEGATVLDGSDPDLGRDGLPWEADGSDPQVHSAPLPGTPGYLARDGRRFYRYNDLDGLRAGLGDDDVPMDEGWVVEGGRLWVRTLDDPAAHSWQVPTLDNGFYLSQVEYLWIQGFEVRFYGSGEYGHGFYLRDASRCVIVRNVVHGVATGLAIVAREGTVADRNLVQENHFHDAPVGEWPWDAVKGTSHEGSAVAVSGGAGNVVRLNFISNLFNGVYLGDWDDQSNETKAFETDVHDNRMDTLGDDGLEPEGACVNVRLWGNEIDRVHSGVSLAPITVGPTWVFRNRFSNYTGTGFKVGNDSAGPVFLYHNTCWTDRPDTNGMSVSGPHGGMVFRNNLVRGTRYAYESTLVLEGLDLDYDGWHTVRSDGGPVVKWNDVRYETLAAWCAATGLECHGSEADPGLADPAGGDFRLAAGSPSIDAGEPIPGFWGWVGAAPDRGYLEFREPGGD